MIEYKVDKETVLMLPSQQRIPDKGEDVTIDDTAYRVIGIHTKLKKEIGYNDVPTIDRYEILLKEKK